MGLECTDGRKCRRGVRRNAPPSFRTGYDDVDVGVVEAKVRKSIQSSDESEEGVGQVEAKVKEGCC